MKQFNLQEYLENPSRPVVTREGKKVRILCTDAKSIYPVIGLVDDGICGERFVSCQINGRESNDVFESKADLFFASLKHEGWMNVYRDKFGTIYGNLIYDNEKRAKSEKNNEDYLTTIKVEWEE